MQNNRHFLYSSILAPTRILFTYVACEDEVCANYVEGEVGKLLAQRCVTETKAFCCILLNFFKCMDLGGIKDKYSLSVPPAAAILLNFSPPPKKITEADLLGQLLNEISISVIYLSYSTLALTSISVSTYLTTSSLMESALYAARASQDSKSAIIIASYAVADSLRFIPTSMFFSPGTKPIRD